MTGQSRIIDVDSGGSALIQRPGVILADPPWMESGGGHRGAQNHYPLMMTEDIAKLPVGQLAAANAHLWLWATDNFLPDALHVARAWGFRYVCSWVWVKPSKGLGQYARKMHEQLLLCSRGASSVPEKAWPQSVIFASKGAHSEKPGAVYELIEHVSAGRRGPRVELFARAARDGWEALGNQAPSAGGADIADQLWSRIDGRPARPTLALGL